MAEASCSGTTPFKRLIDHQSTGINHQDRLVADRPSSASFRSPPAHQSDHAQNAFGAFVGGSSHALPGLPHDPATRLAAHVSTLQPAAYPHPHPHPHPHSQAQHSSFSPLYTHAPPDTRGRSASSGLGIHNNQNLGSSWAADFSRFSAAQAHAPAPQFGFAPQHGAGYNSASNTGAYSAFGGVGSGGAGTGYAGTYAHTAQRPGDFDQEMARWMSAHGNTNTTTNAHANAHATSNANMNTSLNMADVDAAMDQMARELEESEQQSAADFANLSLEVNDARDAQDQARHLSQEQEQELELEQDSAKAAEQLLVAQENLDLLEEQQEPGRLDEEKSAEESGEQEDSGAARSGVAEAAEKLLECVQHEGGEKWQNSVFLSLMRDFRDGRKDIVGDEIRTSAGAGVGDAQAQAEV